MSSIFVNSLGLYPVEEINREKEESDFLKAFNRYFPLNFVTNKRGLHIIPDSTLLFSEEFTYRGKFQKIELFDHPQKNIIESVAKDLLKQCKTKNLATKIVIYKSEKPTGSFKDLTILSGYRNYIWISDSFIDAINQYIQDQSKKGEKVEFRNVIAGALAHELSHIEACHFEKNLRNPIIMRLFSSSVMLYSYSLLQGRLPESVFSAFWVRMLLFNLWRVVNSKRDSIERQYSEYEADKHGITLLARSGKYPLDSCNYFIKMTQEVSKVNAQIMAEFRQKECSPLIVKIMDLMDQVLPDTSTHPPSEDRIRRNNETIKQIRNGHLPDKSFLRARL